MRQAVYDAVTGVGLGLVVAGTGLLYGWPAAMIVAGAGLIGACLLELHIFGTRG